MEDGKEGSPFLEVDIDTAVGEQPRRNPQRNIGLLGDKRDTALHVQDGLYVEVSTGLASFLKPPLERFCDI